MTTGQFGELTELRVRVLLLERALAVVLERLATNGDGDAGEMAAARQAVAEIGQIVRNGPEHVAVRQYRDVFGVTWDDAFAAIARWQPSREAELAQWLWLKRWVGRQQGPSGG